MKNFQILCHLCIISDRKFEKFSFWRQRIKKCSSKLLSYHEQEIPSNRSRGLIEKVSMAKLESKPWRNEGTALVVIFSMTFRSLRPANPCFWASLINFGDTPKTIRKLCIQFLNLKKGEIKRWNHPKDPMQGEERELT